MTLPLQTQSNGQALDSQPQVIKFTSCLPMVCGSLWVLWILPPLRLVAMIKTPKIHTQKILSTWYNLHYYNVVTDFLDIVFLLDLQLPVISTISFIGEGNHENQSTTREPPSVKNHWQILSHNVVSSTPRHEQGSNSQL
jgi:hypothetical protein